MQKNLSLSESQAVNSFLTILAQKKITPKKMYLFGSYARGDFNKSSDIDLLVITNKAEKDEKKIYQTVCQVLDKNDTYLSVKVLDDKEFGELKRLKTPFMTNFLSEAKILWPKTSKPS